MPAAQQKVRILVVEDESIVALDMRSRLTAMGYAVVGLAATGPDAIAICRKESPDLALMDIKLKGDMDGVQASEVIRAEQDIPIIFITAFADEATLARAKVTQAFGYILKPFQEREILISIEMALAKHRLEIDLRESREWLDGSMNAISDAIIAVNAEDSIIFINRAAEKLLGVDDTHARSTPFSSVCTFLSNRALNSLGEQRRFERSGDLVSWVFMESAAGRRPVEVVESAIPGRSGARVFSIRDISEIINAEKNRSRLSAIVATSCDAILSIDSELCIVSWNAGAELMYGYTDAEVIGKNLCEFLVDENERSRLRSLADRVIAGEDVGRFDLLRRCRSGKAITSSTSLSPIRDVDGDVFELACIERDVSAEKEYEASLVSAKLVAEESNRAKSEFLSNMSHELRTPLNSIIGMVGLSRDGCTSSEQREFLDIALQSAENLLYLINSILDFSRIEAGKLSINAVPFDVVDTVADCIEALSVQAASKGLELLFHCESDCQAHLVGDPHRLNQILTNLLANAIKFTEKGSVRVELSSVMEVDAETAIVTLQVQDTGIGMPQDKLDSIWEEFIQLDGSSTRSFGGTGLGLAIVKSLVELMAGSVEVRSKERVGSTFMVHIPFPVALPASVAAPLQPDLQGQEVVLVTPLAEERKILVELLGAWGCHIVQYDTVKSLLAHLHKARKQPRLILVDETIGDRDLLFSCAEDDSCFDMLRSRLAVLSSVVSGNQSGWRSLLGAPSFLIKPVRRDRLLSLLRNGITATDAFKVEPREGTREAMWNLSSRSPTIDDEALRSEVNSIAHLREAINRFFAEISESRVESAERVETVATQFRKELDALHAKAFSRRLFKLILACRKDDREAMQNEIAVVRSSLESEDKTQVEAQ